MAASGTDVVHMLALRGGFLQNPVLLPRQKEIDGKVFVDLLALANRIALVSFFFTKAERKGAKRQRYRELFHWPFLKNLAKNRKEQLLADEATAPEEKPQKRQLDLGLDGPNKKPRWRAPPLGRSQIVTLQAQFDDEIGQVKTLCDFRLRGLWVELSKAAFDYLFRAFRHWRDNEGGVSLAQDLRADGSEESSASDESDMDDKPSGVVAKATSDVFAFISSPRWWRTMWIVKWRRVGERKPNQKSFSVRPNADSVRYEADKAKRYQEALEWTEAFTKACRAPHDEEEGPEEEDLASAYA